MRSIDISPKAKKVLLDIRNYGMIHPEGYVLAPAVKDFLSDREFAHCIGVLIDKGFIEQLSPDQKSIKYIKKRGDSILPEARYKLTDSGYNYLEISSSNFNSDIAQAEAEAKKAKEERFYFILKEIRAWGTLAIALAAFVKSFFL